MFEVESKGHVEIHYQIKASRQKQNKNNKTKSEYKRFVVVLLKLLNIGCSTRI